MEENFNPVARTRANYYTPGSPVQFVCVELLKGELSGENAVCLTFKNISKVTLTALEIHFKCKGVDGIILCEDAFEYREIEVKPGESFGMDDAVFVTQKAITSVDVVLKNVYSGKKVVHLDAIKRVRLPAPRRLSPELEKALESRMNRGGLKYMPQVFENGWYCACGSFHPKEEDTVYCTECGCDRILLQNALNTLLQPGQKAAPAEQAPAAEATRVVSAAPQEEPTRRCRQNPPGSSRRPARQSLSALRPALHHRWSTPLFRKQSPPVCWMPPPARRSPAAVQRLWMTRASVRCLLLPAVPPRPVSRNPRWSSTMRRTMRKRAVTALPRPSSAGSRPSPPSSAQALRCGASSIISL